MKYEFVANPIFVEVMLLFYYVVFTLTILNIDQKKDSNEILSRSTFLYGLASRWYLTCSWTACEMQMWRHCGKMTSILIMWWGVMLSLLLHLFILMLNMEMARLYILEIPVFNLFSCSIVITMITCMLSSYISSLNWTWKDWEWLLMTCLLSLQKCFRSQSSRLFF